MEEENELSNLLKSNFYVWLEQENNSTNLNIIRKSLIRLLESSGIEKFQVIVNGTSKENISMEYIDEIKFTIYINNLEKVYILKKES